MYITFVAPVCLFTSAAVVLERRQKCITSLQASLQELIALRPDPNDHTVADQPHRFDEANAVFLQRIEAVQAVIDSLQAECRVLEDYAKNPQVDIAMRAAKVVHSSGLPRVPSGYINNCSLANGDSERMCQMCGGGPCPDGQSFAAKEAKAEQFLQEAKLSPEEAQPGDSDTLLF